MSASSAYRKSASFLGARDENATARVYGVEATSAATEPITDSGRTVRQGHYRLRGGDKEAHRGGSRRPKRCGAAEHHEGIGREEMKRTLLIACIVFSVAAAYGFGVDVTLKSIEEDIVVRTDGKANFFQSLDWDVSSGQMHGFYLQGPPSTRCSIRTVLCGFSRQHARRIEHQESGIGKVRCRARQWSGHSADRRSTSSTTAVTSQSKGMDRMDHVSRNSGSFSTSIGRAEQWDYPMDHRTIRIELPIVVDR